MLKTNDEKNNLLNSQNSQSKNKELKQKVQMNTNIKNADNKNYKNYNNISNNFQNINKIKNKTFNINDKIKKGNLFYNKSNRNLSVNKSIKKEYFKSNSNHKYNKQNHINYINKEKNINNNNNNDDLNENDNKNIPSHNIIISDLLMRTENFFNNLGLYLKKDNTEKKKLKKIKKNELIFISNELKEQIDNNKKRYEDGVKKNNKIFNNHHKNNIIEEENNYTTDDLNIMENYSEINNNLNLKKKPLKNNKSYNNMNDINVSSNNSKLIEHNIKVYYKKNKNKKMVSDEIIQTFNILDKDEQKEKEKEKEIEIKNEKTIGKLELSETKKKDITILPYLSPSSSLGNLEVDKNKIKIAEVKPVYPVYPYNRIINLSSLNNNLNYNIHQKFILDMKMSHDDIYNYEQLMNRIKFGTKNKKENYKINNNNYRYGQNLSDKNIFSNKRTVKIKDGKEIFFP